jgi:hypothetical protein
MSIIVKGKTIYGPNIITDNLVLYLDAANTKSYPTTGTTWLDLSGYRNNGTLTNGPTFSTLNGGNILFDGIDDYAPFSPNNLPYGASPGTLSAWAYSNNTSGYKWIVSYGNAAISQARFLGINGTDYYFGGYGNDIIVSGAQANKWFNIVGVYEGYVTNLYINGQLASSQAKSWNTVSNNAQVGRQVNFGEYWSGYIPNVSIYSIALNANQVLQNYNATKSRFGL